MSTSLCSSVWAQTRPDSLAMTCAQARTLVARNGAIIIGTGPHVFDRFVASLRFCPAGDIMREAILPTRDTPACPVGGTCVTPFSVPNRFD
ncbi:MAG: hypothetical protein ACRCTD_03605 [Beijerinckiaceae bacterium]